MTKKLQSTTNKLAPILALAVILGIWYACAGFEVVPAYMLPSPTDVWLAFVHNFSVMMSQAKVTLQEALYGLAIGVALAFILSALMDRFHFLYQAIYPILIITQTIPTIAIAPLLVLWMGFGMAPKITLDHHLLPHLHWALRRLPQCGPGRGQPAAGDGCQSTASVLAHQAALCHRLLFLRAAHLRLLCGGGRGDLRVVRRF